MASARAGSAAEGAPFRVAGFWAGAARTGAAGVGAAGASAGTSTAFAALAFGEAFGAFAALGSVASTFPGAAFFEGAALALAGAFYLYALDRHVVPLPGWFTIGMLVGLALLTFVPTRYLYPSLGGTLSRLTNFLGAIWAIFFLGIMYLLISKARGPHVQDDGLLSGLILASLFFPMYYMIASWIVSWQLWRIRRQAAPILSVSPLGADSPQSVLGEKA